MCVSLHTGFATLGEFSFPFLSVFKGCIFFSSEFEVLYYVLDLFDAIFGLYLSL